MAFHGTVTIAEEKLRTGKRLMIRHGEPPYLECSSKGDKRFSAFYARLKGGPHTIEEIYQACKVFEDGSMGLSVKEAKGRKAVNQERCNEIYSMLWDKYIEQNPHLLPVLKQATGLSDVFGQPGHCCQATELWRIRNTLSDDRQSSPSETQRST